MYLHSLDAVHDIIRSWLALAVSCRGSVRSSLAGAGIAGPGAAGTAVGLLSDKETPEDFAEAAAASATSLALAADLEDSHRLLRATLAEHLNEERYCKIETRALKASFDRALLGFNTYRQTRRRAIEQAASQQRSFGLSLFGDSNNSPESDPEFLVIRRLGGVGQYWSDLTCAEITQSATESFRRMSRLLPRQAAYVPLPVASLTMDGTHGFATAPMTHPFLATLCVAPSLVAKKNNNNPQTNKPSSQPRSHLQSLHQLAALHSGEPVSRAGHGIPPA